MTIHLLKNLCMIGALLVAALGLSPAWAAQRAVIDQV